MQTPTKGIMRGERKKHFNFIIFRTAKGGEILLVFEVWSVDISSLLLDTRRLARVCMHK